MNLARIYAHSVCLSLSEIAQTEYVYEDSVRKFEKEILKIGRRSSPTFSPICRM